MVFSHNHPLIPTDIFYSVLEHLTDRRDLYTAALASRDFNKAATPLLYRSLDTDTRVRPWDHKSASNVIHPAYTLLKRPELARHVRHLRETGALHANHPPVTEAVLKALRLCDNLYSFTWIDDTSVSPIAFLSFLDVLRGLPLRAITLRTYSDLGEDTWTSLNTFSNLQKVAVWCMNGPPRVLQGWAPLLGNTLTELELGRCAGVPATILIAVLSQLPHLRDLRLKGAPSSAIPDILTSLPALVALDTEYLRPGLLRPLGRDAQLPLLERLTVRTSSVDLQGPLQLWAWLRALTPHPSLECFTLYAFSTAGQMGIPRGFLLSLARRHADTLRQILLNMTQLTLEDVECVCELFPQLEELSCAVASRDAESIGCAIEKAHNLRSLKLHVYWIPTSRDGDNETSSSYNTYALHSPNSPVARFGLADAETIMRRPGSCLRTVSIGLHMFQGSWVQKRGPDGTEVLYFEVVEESISGPGNGPRRKGTIGGLGYSSDFL
ncbi:hypothetical protein EDB83DRAFT_2288463 [Lactarius deliciosus]|nr:hypothetical protein EDB83DRAFT_2288463 [Lactarius deliciosus]